MRKMCALSTVVINSMTVEKLDIDNDITEDSFACVYYNIYIYIYIYLIYIFSVGM